MASLTLGTRSFSAWAGRSLVIGIVDAEDGVRARASADLPKSAVGQLDVILPALDVSAKVAATTILPAVQGLKADVIVLVGLGSDAGEASLTRTETLRRAAGAAVRATGQGSVALALPHDDAAELAAIAEGSLSGGYTFTAHKSSPKQAAEREFTIFTHLGRKDAAAQVLAQAETTARNVGWARDLVNTAPNLLYPASFTEEVQKVAKASSGKLTVKVLDEKGLAEGHFGGILGVGQGSARPPRIVTLSYSPRGKKAAHIALVGKGITFDSGGLCIKPAASMATMKTDMAGAATVAATVIAAAELGLPVAVTGYLCLAENMPGSNAQRPGDVVTMRNGSTVEIIDTDAEGRMVLADGMALAAEANPDEIIDVATLTGACVIALGPKIFGVMSNDDELSTAIGTAAKQADEASWPLPLPDDLRSQLESQVADVAHKGDRWGGALTAGLFLQDFAKDAQGEAIPWAHLDIAGPSFNEGSPWGHVPKGGTGVAVGTLLAHLRSLA